MRRALALARNGWGMVAPNPMVGAVIVAGDRVVGEGFHAVFGGSHAETVALAVAGEAARGATMYVTLEPCTHFGKTPPCADAVIRAGIARVVVASLDPSPLAGGGVAKLRDAGITVDVGVLRDEAHQLNKHFFHSVSSPRPWITVKLAITLDAAIAERAGSTSRVTGQAARHYAHWLRAGHDAVAVGLGTVRADNPQLTVRESVTVRQAPARVVFSRSGDLPLSSSLAQTARTTPVFVTMCRDALRSDTIERLHQAGVRTAAGDTLREQLDELRRQEVRSILVEGGAVIAAEFWKDDLIDELVLLQAPRVFGRGALNAFSSLSPEEARARTWTLVSQERLGDDVAMTYTRAAGTP